MFYYTIKVLISAIIIVLISEIAKRSEILGAILASIPIVSVLGIFWLYNDTKSITAVSTLSKGIFWMVIPSLIFFITFPILLRFKINFALSMTIALSLMIIGYFLMLLALRYFGIRVGY